MSESFPQIWAMRKRALATMNGLLIPGLLLPERWRKFFMRRIGRLSEPAFLVLGVVPT
jgi:hypothetical protein